MNKPNRKLLDMQFRQAEHVRQELVVYPEAGTAIEEMQRAEYWAHVANRLRPYDRIEVRPADGSWWAELLVRVVEPMAVRVHVLRHETFGVVAGVAETDIPEGYEVRHRGPDGWCVVRLSDNEMLHKREPSRSAAAVWLTGHIQRLAPALPAKRQAA